MYLTKILVKRSSILTVNIQINQEWQEYKYNRAILLKDNQIIFKHTSLVRQLLKQRTLGEEIAQYYFSKLGIHATTTKANNFWTFDDNRVSFLVRLSIFVCMPEDTYVYQ